MTRRGLRELWDRAWCPLHSKRRNAPERCHPELADRRERDLTMGVHRHGRMRDWQPSRAAWALSSVVRSLSRLQRVRDDKGLGVGGFHRWNSADQRATKRVAVYIARLLTWGVLPIQIRLCRSRGEVERCARELGFFLLIFTAALIHGRGFFSDRKELQPEGGQASGAGFCQAGFIERGSHRTRFHPMTPRRGCR